MLYLLLLNYDLFQTLMKAITECPQAFIITPFAVPPTADAIKGIIIGIIIYYLLTLQHLRLL